MILVDIHCHLTHECYKDNLPEVIERAKKAGLKAIVCSGVNTPTNREALELAKKYDIVKCSLGIHPTDICNFQPDDPGEYGLSRQRVPLDVDEELEFIKANKDKIVAIGEVGLDFHWVKDEKKREEQIVGFKKIIKAVEKINKPLILHSWAADKECLDLLEPSKLKKVVLHCFGGNKKLIKRAIDLGYSFSIPPSIVKLQHYQMIAELAPLSQLLTETDAPWQSPVSGTKNESSNVKFVIEKIAEIKQLTAEEVANAVWMNYQRMF